MVPLSMVSSRLIARQRVDLPEPLGPMMTTTSPRPIVVLMSLSTWRSPKCLLTRSSTTSGSMGLPNHTPSWGVNFEAHIANES
jgi:hypothetical protein